MTRVLRNVSDPRRDALHGTVSADPHATPYALLAVAVTIGVHLAFGRRTILSVGAGTAVHVVLVSAV
ncbi:hypothetical protein [Streptomyces sporangiiformans]|uniref:hypothetical protein n=1 Tax=Streptomyces sporangiiformans TaxID=2315329 RepID=UPI0023E19B61|nr:hypothetical protein [Streptomyces sporangiiformans]